MNSKNLVITLVLIIAVGAAAFYGGMKYQQSKRTGNFQTYSFNGGQGNGMMRLRSGNNQNFRPVRGEIISSDDKSITVKLTDGGSKIVLLSDKTALLETSIGAKSDLKTGTQVMVIGSENSDGSLTAQDIQINPQNFRSASGSGQQK